MFFVSSYAAHRDLHSFPTRRSSDLSFLERILSGFIGTDVGAPTAVPAETFTREDFRRATEEILRRQAETGEDRKSTRLNSSHVKISYAVFCLKKKRTQVAPTRRATH